MCLYWNRPLHQGLPKQHPGPQDGSSAQCHSPQPAHFTTPSFHYVYIMWVSRAEPQPEWLCQVVPCQPSRNTPRQQAGEHDWLVLSTDVLKIKCEVRGILKHCSWESKYMYPYTCMHTSEYKHGKANQNLTKERRMAKGYRRPFHRCKSMTPKLMEKAV